MAEPLPQTPVREIRLSDLSGPRPIYVVWEITTKCDQPCQHCGSRAGPTRPSELSTEQAMDTCERLAKLEAREVTLIGGEAYLRSDALAIVEKLTSLGIRVSMQTGGRAFTRERARAFKSAGLAALGVSIDGLALAHDKLRGNLGSFRAALSALEAGGEVGLQLSANTQVNRLNWPTLKELARLLRERRVETWQVQLTGPMGRAADHPEWILEPYRVVDVMRILAEIQAEAALDYREGRGAFFNVFPNNNIGYFGPYEQILRSRPGSPEAHYQGCLAGIYGMGIESDGTVKGCPTLPTEAYAGGNLLETPLEELWERSPELRFARDRTTDELWGHCKGCYYAEVCRAGCSWMVHTTLGRRGNNPFCFHRVVELAKRGVREKLVHLRTAPKQMYDHGLFAIEEEPWPEGESLGAIPSVEELVAQMQTGAPPDADGAA